MRALALLLNHPRSIRAGALLLGVLLASEAAIAAEPPDLEQIAAFHRDKGRADAAWLLRQNLDEPEVAMAALMERRKARPNYSLMQDAMQVCRDVAIYGRANQDPRTVAAAVAFADAVLRRSVTPSGAFVEYDRNTWLKPAELWRTIPWGTAFCGNRAFEAWLALREDFTPAQRIFWREELMKTGAWIHRNPVMGGYVFNNVIDLCRLLWRLGRECGRADWCEWALDTAARRIQRDVDEEGWIQGENGGASGAYQMIGAEYLARFAREAKSPVLQEAVRRIFARSTVPYAAPGLRWPANFGTRSSGLRTVDGGFVLVAAALGDPQAAAWVRSDGRPEWSDDPALWQAALAQSPRPPTYPAVQAFAGISGTVVREGPWVAYFGNYDRSVWARGFANLWHAGHRDWVFSTLNSLHGLSATEKAKARVDDLDDWAGFPHVRVTGDGRRYDSQKRISALETNKGDGVTVNWTEPLLDGEGHPGGELRSSYRFNGPVIEMTLGLSQLAGESRLDFHLLRRPNGFTRLWLGEEVADILAGRLLHTAGDFADRRLSAAQPPLYGIQVDRTTFVFETIELPPGAVVTLVGETPAALHSDNLGGFRFRIVVPAAERSFTVKLRVRAVE